MIHTLDIAGYRCFPDFHMENLARVNLLVGTNNSGKTSVLEATSLLASNADPDVLWTLLQRRGERIAEEGDRSGTVFSNSLDISHLFSGHLLKPNMTFKLDATNETPAKWVQFRVVDRPRDRILPSDQEPLFNPTASGYALATPLAVEVTTSVNADPVVYALSRRGGLSREVLFDPLIPRSPPASPSPVRYISTESLTSNEIATYWEKIVLTKEEERVVEALQLIEPAIERIAVIGGITASAARGGIKLKVRGLESPVPAGSMGDGIWRMLAMAIAVIRSENGYLFVDEIDTGLHYSVMRDMWKMVATTAGRLNVQVFATTHSSDCVNSLAAICRRDSNANTDASLQRVERGNDRAIAFTEREIIIAAERGIEAR
jgi:hypothetical protein